MGLLLRKLDIGKVEEIDAYRRIYVYCVSNKEQDAGLEKDEAKIVSEAYYACI